MDETQSEPTSLYSITGVVSLFYNHGIVLEDGSGFRIPGYLRDMEPFTKGERVFVAYNGEGKAYSIKRLPDAVELPSSTHVYGDQEVNTLSLSEPHINPYTHKYGLVAEATQQTITLALWGVFYLASHLQGTAQQYVGSGVHIYHDENKIVRKIEPGLVPTIYVQPQPEWLPPGVSDRETETASADEDVAFSRRETVEAARLQSNRVKALEWAVRWHTAREEQPDTDGVLDTATQFLRWLTWVMV